MQKKGFTLIEMMIALGIFSVGILTILNLLINNLYFLDKASTRTQASLLAKEGIELVYNLRDSNLIKSYPWNCIPYENSDDNFRVQKLGNYDNNDQIKEICRTIFGSENGGSIFDIRFSEDGYYTIINPNKGISNREEIFDNYEMFPETIGKYARYLILKPLVSLEGNTNISTDNILKIESHVLYKNGTRTGEVIFESFIGNHD